MDCNIKLTSLIMLCSWLAVITANCNGKSGFQKLPKPMKLSTYKEKIIGRVAQVMYQLESPRWAFGLHRLQCVSRHVESTDGTSANRFDVVFKFRKDGVNCVNGTAPRFHVDDGPVKYAVFDEPNLFTPGLYMRLFVFTSHPTLYALVFLCMDNTTVVDGECQGDFSVNFNVFGHAPDMVAWKHMSCDLETELGLTMMDTRMRFLYLNDECPGAPTRDNRIG